VQKGGEGIHRKAWPEKSERTRTTEEHEKGNAKESDGHRASGVRYSMDYRQRRCAAGGKKRPVINAQRREEREKKAE